MEENTKKPKCKICDVEADVLCKGLCSVCFLKAEGIPFSWLCLGQSYVFQLMQKYILNQDSELEAENEQGLPEGFISKTTIAFQVSKILNKLGEDT